MTRIKAKSETLVDCGHVLKGRRSYSFFYFFFSLSNMIEVTALFGIHHQLKSSAERPFEGGADCTITQASWPPCEVIYGRALDVVLHKCQEASRSTLIST
jgi:hypothetical protein